MNIYLLQKYLEEEEKKMEEKAKKNYLEWNGSSARSPFTELLCSIEMINLRYYVHEVMHQQRKRGSENYIIVPMITHIPYERVLDHKFEELVEKLKLRGKDIKYWNSWKADDVFEHYMNGDKLNLGIPSEYWEKFGFSRVENPVQYWRENGFNIIEYPCEVYTHPAYTGYFISSSTYVYYVKKCPCKTEERFLKYGDGKGNMFCAGCHDLLDK